MCHIYIKHRFHWIVYEVFLDKRSRQSLVLWVLTLFLPKISTCQNKIYHVTFNKCKTKTIVLSVRVLTCIMQ